MLPGDPAARNDRRGMRAMAAPVVKVELTKRRRLMFCGFIR